MFAPTTRFLVIDDFKTMRTIVKKSLSNLGFTNFVEAEDGAKAFQALEAASAANQPIDVVVSDWNMPNMSGLDLLKKCRSNEKYKGIPFMLVTAENEQKQVLEAAKAGVSNYIVKPFTPQQFQQKLEQVFVRHSKKPAAA